jgi:hypothetical protein
MRVGAQLVEEVSDLHEAGEEDEHGAGREVVGGVGDGHDEGLDQLVVDHRLVHNLMTRATDTTRRP